MQKNREALVSAVLSGMGTLRDAQVEFICDLIHQLQQPVTMSLGRVTSDMTLISREVGERIGDALQIHHAFSRQALTKDKFEFALESALQKAGVSAELVENRTNRGHDITIAGVPVSLKTQADANIRRDSMHISKFMELGQGKWELSLLRDQFFEHMQSYDRIFQFRCLEKDDGNFEYELVEIPKKLLLKAATGQLEVMENSRQNPKPGYCRVYRDASVKTDDSLLFALYFDGGTERKLQVKNIRKSECIVHANWKFRSASLE